MRVDGGFDGGYLVHHLLVHGQAARRVHDDHVVLVLLGVVDGVLGYLHGVLVAFLGIHGDVQLPAQHLQLVDGRRAVHVARHQQGALAPLGAQHVGQLAREGGLARPLQTRH